MWAERKFTNGHVICFLRLEWHLKKPWNFSQLWGEKQLKRYIFILLKDYPWFSVNQAC